MHRRTLSIAALILGIFFWCPTVTRANDASEFQRVISEQIAAFNADDGAKAYSYAAPIIKQIFPNPDMFMSMVKRGYQPVYRQQSFSFTETDRDSLGRPTQSVRIIDKAGKSWTAVYSFEQQPDGSWKISSCTLVETPGADV